MPKYNVTILRTVQEYFFFEVDAANEKDANLMALAEYDEKAEDGNVDPDERICCEAEVLNTTAMED